MSKIADLIRRVTRIEPSPLGFGAMAHKRPPTMALVALAGERWASATADATGAGADAVILTGRAGESEIAEAAKAAGDCAFGLRTTDLDADRLPKLRKAGVDFLMLDLESPAAALMDEELGFVIHLRGEQTDVQLRTLEASPADAISIEQPQNAATIGGLLELRRVVALTHRALLSQVRTDAQQAELLALRQAGVALVAVDMKERGAVDAIERLRGVIDELPAPPKRRRDEAEIRLPTAAARPAPVEHDHDDDDEDED